MKMNYKNQESAIGKITTDIIQAINRVRCRRVTDSSGNCKPTNIFLFINREQKSEVILGKIKEMMPGIVVHETLDTSLKKLTSTAAKIVNSLRCRPKGTYDAAAICRELGISSRTKDRTLGTALADSPQKLLKSIGATYKVKRGNQGFMRFIKG